MLTSIKRVIRSGFVDFWRNSVISIASVFVMTVTLFVIGSIVFLQAMLDSTLMQIRDKVDINVYFVLNADESEILALKTTLEGLAEVATAEYLSSEQVYENFKQKHSDDELTLQALDELGDNPLGAVLNIKAKQTSQYETIALFLEQSDVMTKDGISIIDKINYHQNKQAIDKLTSIIASSERLGFIITIVLIVMSILITFNTIRLAIYTSKDEIGVMRLVGASNMYIRGPFVIEGIMAGGFSAIISLALFYPFTYWLSPVTESSFNGESMFAFYVNNFEEFFLIIIGTGVALGAVSSYLAVKRYLKV